MKVIKTKIMKKLITFIIFTFSLLAITSCEDKLDIIFTDYYTYVDDGSGISSMNVAASTDKFVVTTYVHLVATNFDDVVTVDYDVTCGDGLTEGVDYKLINSSKTVTFQPGIVKMPVRLELYASSLDSSKDNTITITLTGCSENLNLGYPGPDALFKSFVIKKY